MKDQHKHFNPKLESLKDLKQWWLSRGIKVLFCSLPVSMLHVFSPCSCRASNVTSLDTKLGRDVHNQQQPTSGSSKK
jgi:hypothetical protein